MSIRIEAQNSITISESYTKIFRHILDVDIVLSDIKNVKAEKFEIYFPEK